MEQMLELSARELSEWLRAGRVSVMDVAQHFVDYISERDVTIRAFSFFDPAMVMRQARALDTSTRRGPLFGVPVAVKDTINTRDMPTEHNSSRYRGSVPGVDAACVDTLRAAGALIMGKTRTTEFAAAPSGVPTRNPLDPARTPGGSSSGSAAAVADRQVPLALGTQTGGSVIRPASFTGVFGWKPTWNSVSREGAKVWSATTDTIGFFGRSVDDFSLLADVFRLPAGPDSLPADLRGARVAVCRTHLWEQAEPSTRRAVEDLTPRMLRAAGAEVEFVEVPRSFDELSDAIQVIFRSEGHAAFLNEYENNPVLDARFVSFIEDVEGLDAHTCREAYRVVERCRADIDDVLAAFDFVVAPSAPGEAPLGTATTGNAMFNSFWTFMKVPVVNVPGLRGESGMPVGLSVVTRAFDDRIGLHWAGRLASLLEKAE